MKRHIPVALLSLTLALLLSACGGGGGSAQLGAKDIATVGQQKVTKDQLDALMNIAKRGYEVDKRPFPKPGTADYNTLQSQGVALLVQRAEFAQEAADKGIKVTDKQVDDRIEKFKKQSYHGSDKQYEDALKQQGISDDQARDIIRSQLISEKLYAKITANVHVSDAAVAAYYAQNKATYVQKQSRDIRHILVNTNQKALADQLYNQLVANHEKNFAALAKKYSKDPGSAANGGRLTITKGQTVPPFDKTAFSLKTGELSKPVKTTYGWHIIQALSPIKPPSTTPLKTVKDSIRNQLEQQKKNEVMTKWVEDLKKPFCKPGKITYAPGYAPNPNPCATSTTSTSSK